MNTTSMLRWSLLLLVAGSLAVFAFRKSAAPTPTPVPADELVDALASAPATVAPAPAPVTVTYFTTNVRCESCRKIESLTKHAIETNFAAELAAGKLAFRVINTDFPEHAHFVEHYEITNKTVIVSRHHEGREVEWVNRQDVWLLLDEPAEFAAYVCEPVRSYLTKG
ncbi:MAG: hypothetical protein IT455_18025 [Planctomycetes bacterium]|nr:hypothetical protein [Planctomycetota bacterium]